MGPKFNVLDFWYRFEWQHRGSTHVHGFLWLQGAPNVDEISVDDADAVRSAIEYFDGLVSAIHPNVNYPPTHVHPCQVKYLDVTDPGGDLASLLHRVQRHTQCTTRYCLRVRRGDSEARCRFNFPQPMEAQSSIVKDDKGRLEFRCARNDELLNRYNAFIMSRWRANMDIQPIISMSKVTQYIAKYAAKAEPRSEQYDELLGNIIDKEVAEEGGKKLFINYLFAQFQNEIFPLKNVVIT